jgi:hypothetical protein
MDAGYGPNLLYQTLETLLPFAHPMMAESRHGNSGCLRKTDPVHLITALDGKPCNI